MPEFERDIEQGSAQWLALRRGVISASNAHRLLTPAKRKTYALELLGETLAIEMPEQFVTAAMQWGIDQEPAARSRYEIESDSTVEEVGFAWHSDYEGSVGCSPDGLVGDDGLIEIKCPSSKAHVEHMLYGAGPEYRAQMQFQLFVCDRAWCDFVSFDPRINAPHDFMAKRYERDDAMIAKLREGADEVLERIKQAFETLKARD